MGQASLLGYDTDRMAFVRKNTKTVVLAPERERSESPTSHTPREMSLGKAKKLIRKTSDEHKGLFRRLAK